MKKIIFFFVLLLVHISTLFSQSVPVGDYEIYVTGWIEGAKHHNCGEAYVDVTVNGGGKDIVKRVFEAEYGVHSPRKYYSKPNLATTFKADQYIKKLNSSASRYAKESKCSGKRYNNQGQVDSGLNISCYTLPFKFDGTEGFKNIRVENGKGLWYCSMTLYIRPVLAIIDKSQTTGKTDQNIITYEDKIIIDSHSGFKYQEYNWEYSRDGFTNWKSLSKYNGQSSISANADDILSDEQDKGSWRKIFIRQVACDKSIKSNIVVYTTMKTAPYITSVEPISPKCVGDADGGVRIFFNRSLTSGELLKIYYGLDLKKSVDVTSLDSDNSFKLTGLSAGNQTLQVAGWYNDSPMHSSSENHKKSVTITDPTPVFFKTESITNITCKGANNGSLKISASGGAGEYKLYYKKASDDPSLYIEREFKDANQITISNLFPEEYEFYVMDKNGCYQRDIDGNPVIDSETLTEPSESVMITLLEDAMKEPSGYGRCDGYMTVHVEGGTKLDGGNYSIEWKNKLTGAVVNTVSNITEVDGFKSKLDNIAVGTYIVTAKDKNGCEKSAEYVLEGPIKLEVTVKQDKPILCEGGNNASLSVSAKGGIPSTTGDPYNYHWYKMKTDLSDSTLIVFGRDYITELTKGVYKVYASDGSTPANIEGVQFEVTEPKQPTATFTFNNIKCKEGSDGTISVTFKDGTAGYTVYYKKAGDIQKSVKSSGVSNIINIRSLTAGTYTLFAQDANGCVVLFGTDKLSNVEVTLTEPSSKLEIISRDIVIPSGAGRTDGNITIKIKGGVQFTTGDKYKIVWKNSFGATIMSSDSLASEGVVISKIKDLVKGNYTVSISDANSTGGASPCILTSVIYVDEPKPLTVSLEVTHQIDCNGNKTAEITAAARGGITRVTDLPYTYAWYKMVDGQEIFIENVADSILSNIGVGIYKVKIEDGSSPVNQKESETITVIQPDALHTEIVTQNISCFDGSNGKIQIKVSGGVPAYKMYYKNTSSEESVYTEVDADNNIFILNNLKACTYSIYIKDKNGCYAPINEQEISEITLTEPDEALYIKHQNINTPTGKGRSDGSIALTVDGGTPKDTEPRYEIVWKNESGQIISHFDSLNKDNLLVTKIANREKGLYSVYIKDKNSSGDEDGCSLNLNIELKEPEPLTVALENTKTINCYGFNSGELVAHVKGGIQYVTGMPYKYKWYKIVDGKDISVSPSNDSILSNLSIGSYKVFIEDGSSLTNTVESTVFEINQPTEQITSVKIGGVSCYNSNDGFIHISVTGGTGSHHMYLKRNQSDKQYREISFDDTSKEFIANDLLGGTYSVYILDENDCYASINGKDIANITVKGVDFPLYIKEENIFETSGYNKNDGEINLVISGGTPLLDDSYIVIWKDSVGNVLNSQNSVIDNGYRTILSNLKEGKFTLEVRDLNYNTQNGENNKGCIFTKEYELIEPEELKVSIEQPWVVSCNGMYDAQLVAHVVGGVENPQSGLPYKYKWYKMLGGTYEPIPAVEDSVLNNVGTGNYRVEIEDFSRKTNTAYALYTIIEPDGLQAKTEDIFIECGQTGRISVDISGGTLPYSYEWNTGDTSSYVENVHPGRYMVYVEDARGCDITASINVKSPGDLYVTGKVSNPVCYGASNGNIILNVTGGVGPYIYTWSNGATTKDIVALGAGVYTVVVTEQGGCTYSESFTLIDPEALSVSLGGDALICLGQIHKIKPEVEDPKTKFAWTSDNGFESKESEVNISLAGTYYLTITDSKGCQASDKMTLSLTDYGISSEMVVATDVFAKDTVVFVNISYPNPDRIEWIIPENIPARVVAQTDEILQVIFDETGQYSLGMRAHLKDCFQDVIKTITVTNSEGAANDNFGETDIKEFIVYPNPSNGKFKVSVILNKEVGIRLRLFSLGVGRLVDDRTEKGSRTYEIQYEKYLSAGTYILLLETPSGRKSFKVVIR